ncbi:LysR family transcriptional regulator [Cupriavidus sp. H18C1]|uniref:LysR family transcriptional regulator n=1 Tax=Cupriavidus sp. H18C1 TaxID=3241601 RepID=UPI003BB89C2E
MAMNLKQLETLALVAELGSLSRAARTLGVAQSLVSRGIGQLEAEWGDRLFERTGRGVVLSEFGRRVMPQVELLLAQSARLRDEIKDSAGVPSGVVRIGVLSSMARQLVARLFESLRARAPGVRLHFTEGFSGQLDEQLASGRLDIAVISRYGPAARQDEDVMGQVATYLVCAAGHPLARRRRIALRELAGLPLVLPPAPNGLRSILDQHARQLGIALDIVLEVESLATMKDVAMGGHAMTILPMLGVDEEVRNGRLAVIEIVEPALPRTIAIGLTRHHPLSRAARLVLAELHTLVPALLPGAAQAGRRRTG